MADTLLSERQGKRPILQVENLTKRFGGLVAVDQISLSISAGEVVGLLGDNGAGKSTLIKMISGVYRPDAGQLCFQGREVCFSSPLEARQLGIETIYQDLALCENLDAPANIFLGRELTRRTFGGLAVVDRVTMRKEAQKILSKLNIPITNVDRPMHQMSGGQRQAVAIARAIYWNARLLIMDEPTAALAVPEQRKVLDLIQTLKQRDIAVLLISHNLQEVFSVADRVLVLRRGTLVGERPISHTTTRELVGLMVNEEDEKQNRVLERERSRTT